MRQNSDRLYSINRSSDVSVNHHLLLKAAFCPSSNAYSCSLALRCEIKCWESWAGLRNDWAAVTMVLWRKNLASNIMWDHALRLHMWVYRFQSWGEIYLRWLLACSLESKERRHTGIACYMNNWDYLHWRTWKSMSTHPVRVATLKISFYFLEFIYVEWGSLEYVTLRIDILCSTTGLLREKILIILPILRSQSTLVSHTHWEAELE